MPHGHGHIDEKLFGRQHTCVWPDVARPLTILHAAVLKMLAFRPRDGGDLRLSSSEAEADIACRSRGGHGGDQMPGVCFVSAMLNKRRRLCANHIRAIRSAHAIDISPRRQEISRSVPGDAQYLRQSLWGTVAVAKILERHLRLRLRYAGISELRLPTVEEDGDNDKKEWVNRRAVRT